jgi:23S rRNA (uracil1939-C5)-methyltransferase
MARSRSRSPASREPIPLVIEKLSHEGRGLARHEGKVVFVEGALPQEKVLARIMRNKGAYAEAAVVEVLERSAARVDPPCRHYHTCGGCSLQHLDSTSQLAFKNEMLHERLAHATPGRSYEILPALTDVTSGYRRKARLAVRHVPGKGKVLVGFREKHSNFITDMDSCEVLVEPVSGLLPALSALIGSLQARETIPQVEVAVGDAAPGRASVALVFRHLQALNAADRQLLDNFGREHGLVVYLQPKGPDSVHRLDAGAGEDRLFYTLPEFGLELAFHPLDFTQVNAGINRRMLSRAMALLEPGPDDRVLDLFCGLGNFTLPIATRAGFVTGVEGVAEMVARGQENAARNGLGNVSFHCADLAASHEQYAWLQDGYNKVLLDPPRSGAMEIIPALVVIRPARIVYVSCNPATLARDAELLAAEGYRLMSAGAMDMFPHTSHVEAMALFTDERAASAR